MKVDGCRGGPPDDRCHGPQWSVVLILHLPANGGERCENMEVTDSFRCYGSVPVLL